MTKSNRRFAILAVSLVVILAAAFSSAFAQAPAAQQPAVQTAAAPVAPPAPPDVAAVPADAEKSATGLAWKVLQAGKGSARPARTDRVTVNYTGWSTAGVVFDSTVLRNKPSVFVVGNVLPGMSEGIQLMTVGEKRRFWMPENLAFKGAAGRPAGTCVFEIELLDVQPGAPTGVPAPADVAAPPAEAEKTKSGLASKVIKAGTGKVHPSSRSQVTVHYSGWTPDGKMFDSSVLRGEAATFGLDQVIKGWTEGVQLMVEGETRRFWIPGNLAYDGINREGAPKGMLVFDVELIKIH